LSQKWNKLLSNSIISRLASNSGL